MAAAIIHNEALKISRKNFFKLAAAAPLLPGALAAQGQAEKVEKAAIKGTTDAVTAFITTTDLDAACPPTSSRRAKRCLVDGFGVILAGSTVKGSAIVRDYVEAVGDRKDATALGAGRLHDVGRARGARQRARAATRWTTTTRSCRRRPIGRSAC